MHSPTHSTCSSQFVREPSNSYSDFSFLAVGLFMMYCGWRDLSTLRSMGRDEVVSRYGSNWFRLHPLLSIANGAMNCIHAVGTAYNHACRCHTGHRVDCFGMFGIIAFVSAYTLLRLVARADGKQARSGVVALFLALFGLLLVPLWTITGDMYYPLSLHQETRVFIMVLLPVWTCTNMSVCVHHGKLTRLFVVATCLCVGQAIVCIGLYIWRYSGHSVADHKRVGAALGLLLLCAVMQEADKRHILCWPRSLVQGHAMWHVGNAVVLVVAYQYLRSERGPGHDSKHD